MGTEFSGLLATSVGGMTIATILSLAVTVLICLIAIRIIMKLVTRIVSKSKLDPRIQKYLLVAVKVLLYAVAVLIIMDKLRMETSSLVALLSVGSLGLTLAAEDILGNMAGGLVILSSHPFAIGDFIEAAGTSGTVQEITLNHTKLLTPDGLVVLLPNKTLSGSQMTNYSALGRRRVTRKITASYDAPTDTVKAACRKALEATADILQDPAPSVYLSDYGASSIEYTVFCWCSTERYWDVYFTLQENLRTAFENAGVEMTYDHLNVHILNQ